MNMAGTEDYDRELRRLKDDLSHVASSLDKGIDDFNQIVGDYPGRERFGNLFEKKRELSN